MSSPNAHKSILFVNQHYYPDIAATGQKLTDLAEYLAACGHHITVLCSKGRYVSGVLEAPAEEVRNGVRIFRKGGNGRGRRAFLARIIDYASFYLRVFFFLLFTRRQDFVVLLTTPPLLSFLGAVMAKLKGQRYGIWSMDLHPDAEELLGILRPTGWVARTLHRLNDVGYRNASFVVDLGVYMKRRILQKGVQDKKLYTIPLWDRVEEFGLVTRHENPLIKALGLEDKFVVMYSGNAGLAHRFEEILYVDATTQESPAHLFPVCRQRTAS